MPVIESITTTDAQTFTFKFKEDLAENVEVKANDKKVESNSVTLGSALTTGNELKVEITVPATDDNKEGTKTITYTVTQDEGGSTWTVDVKEE